jgi:23S rRNA (cytosine1962-C5)-methyltransferase
LRAIELNKQGAARLSLGKCDFYEKDIIDSIKSFQPGEWILINQEYVGFLNPFVQSGPILRVIRKLKKDEGTIDPPCELISLLEDCYLHRTQFDSYKNYRLCYGDSDRIPGLIIDVFENCVLIQVNTAGVDKFRNEIEVFLKEKYKSKEIVFFDNKKYRENEVLPIYESTFNSDVKVFENDFKYEISNSTIQKVGYYFDHRENRLKLESFLKRMGPLSRGMDLFCYTGSWGLHMLRGNVKEVEFVDQANMTDNISRVLEDNDLSGRGSFVRRDVFSHLDLSIQNHERFDIIVNDPPAFSKSEKNVHKALGGYEKLHFKALQLINNKGLYVAASCTHGVSLLDLDKTVDKAARRLGKRIVMLDTGVQGFDHPFTSFESKSFYIKYLLYQVYE